MEDLTIAPRLTWFIAEDGLRPLRTAVQGGDAVTSSKRRSFIGTEWDTVVTYNYTDDVQFGVIYALFAPGNVYRTPNDSTAQELITSVSVKF